MRIVQPNYNNQQQFQQQYPQQQQQQQYEEEEPEEEDQVNQQIANNFRGAVYPNQDQGFLKWLLDYRKQTVEPLRHVWRGEEYDYDNHAWIQNKNHPPIMNEDGITWGISLIESYCSPVFLATELDETTYHHYMKEVCRDIINGMCSRWRDFGVACKTDIMRICNEIESKIGAVLRGALHDGYRDFFSTQNSSIETRNLTPNDQPKRPGMFSSMANMFKRQNQQQF